MTTKDYVRLARIIRDRRPLAARATQRTGPIEIRNVAIDAATDTLDVIARDLADMLADDNPRFKRSSREWARGKVSGTASALCRQMEDRYSIRAEMRSRGIL